MANRKPRRAYTMKLEARGKDAHKIVRLYKAKDLKALDAMGYSMKAVPRCCCNSTMVGKPASMQDRRPRRKTTPKRPSPLRKCISAERETKDSATK